MVEREDSEHCNGKEIRQQATVPFLWEEKPGTPKKDWKPQVAPVNQVPSPPVKLVASIPFKWEEKPGKPLHCFSHLPCKSMLSIPPTKPINFPSTPVCTRGNDDEDSMFALDLEAFESFGSVSSLLANQLISTVAISSAVPVQENNSQPETKPSSPTSETGSSTSSYATGTTTSLVGASFLECLFPLFTPDSSFLEKSGCTEKDSFLSPPDQQNKDFDRESNCSVVARRATTLGELIQMSRRRSDHMKALQTRKQDLPMGFTEKAFGCCIFGSHGDRFERLHWKKRRQLGLK